ncbi:hypothetical protein VK792_03750 [Mesobacterium sp. TK19101]|uniref:Uncharacterized protein n=1 Tax=Mesobacterium hydrothermale TaxID=3111907 RepID=A0ABU6HD38_9RHOB|nr:hypothetical protein [Mesobacterium sp. TK19101]MEC3860387.1 hypothetical protein [Mesobacterium sp. TK19101]
MTDRLPPKVKPPVFVERQTYRQRRVMDAARMLPILGAFLWLLPLLWFSSGGGPATSRAVLYIFGVWCLLIFGAALLSKGLRDATGTEGSETDLS